MTRVAISVEGQTEEAFINRILAPSLQSAGVYLYPILLGEGGNVTVDRLASDMARLVRSFDFVTSLVDFYGFRNKGSDTREELETRIREAAVARINRPLDDSRVFPYVQRHEFEALLFSDASAFSILPYAESGGVDALLSIRSGFDTPEDIDDSPESAPSKRIKTLIPGYRKAAGGALVAEEIGLERIRAECPGFNAWAARLNSLAAATPTAPLS